MTRVFHFFRPVFSRPVFLALLVLFALLFSLYPAEAHAGGCNWWTLCLNKPFEAAVNWGADQLVDMAGGIVIGLVSLVLQLLAALFWQIVSLVTRLFTFVLYEVNQEIGFVDNILVIAGWSIVRDVMNWFFVIIFLVSAVATILDYPRYNARSILPRLLIVAVLVNFSLWISGFFVNVAQVVTGIFVTVMSGAYDDVGQAFLNAAAIQDLRTPDLSVAFDFVSDTIDQQLTDFLGLLFSIVMLVVFGFAMAFLTVAIIVRNVMVWVLMILSPMAFVAAILPATQRFWSQWLQKFTQYTVFLPIAVFFVWLGTWLIVLMEDVSTLWGATATGDAYESSSTLMLSINEGLQFVTIVVFLFMSVIVTKWFASEAGGIAQRSVGKAAIGGLGVAALGARGARAGALRTSLAQRAGNVASRVPGGGRIAERLYTAQQTYNVGRGEKQAERNLDQMPDKDLKELAKRSARGGAERAPVLDRDAEIARQSLKRGIDLEEHGWSEKRQIAALKRLDTFGRGQEVASMRPDLAAKAGILKSQKAGEEGHDTTPEGMKKALAAYAQSMSGKDLASMHASAIELDPSAPDELKQALVEGMQEAAKNNRLLGSQLGAVGRAASEGDKNAMKTVEAINKNVLGGMKASDLGERTRKYLLESPVARDTFVIQDDVSGAASGGGPKIVTATRVSKEDAEQGMKDIDPNAGKS